MEFRMILADAESNTSLKKQHKSESIQTVYFIWNV